MTSAHATRAAISPNHLPLAEIAARAIEGERYATRHTLIASVPGQRSPTTLAVMVDFLRGEMLAGFCRLLQKALESRNG